jgi:hypothetical protein
MAKSCRQWLCGTGEGERRDSRRTGHGQMAPERRDPDEPLPSGITKSRSDCANGAMPLTHPPAAQPATKGESVHWPCQNTVSTTQFEVLWRGAHHRENRRPIALSACDSTCFWHRSCNAAMHHSPPTRRDAKKRPRGPGRSNSAGPAIALPPALRRRDAGGNHGREASAPIRHIRSPVFHVYPYPSPVVSDGAPGGNRMVNIKMPPDQFCVSSSGADQLASHIQYMVFSMLNGAADACGR